MSFQCPCIAVAGMSESVVKPRREIQPFEGSVLEDLRSSYEALDDGSWVHGSVQSSKEVSLIVKDQDGLYVVSHLFRLLFQLLTCSHGDY
jgi:hypothetical protein